MTSPSSPAGDRARATVTVAVPPERAFRLFTAEINLWWRRGPRFRNLHGDQGIICIEPRVGGRVFESVGEGANETVFVVGKVKLWQPSERLIFEWRASNFAPDERTEVDVTFAPSASGTRVTVEHRGWSAIRADHPVRHGQDVAAFIRMMGMWWGDQLTSLRLTAVQ
jgi:uncharacterized protein YndB with AHSA1/START domain